MFNVNGNNLPGPLIIGAFKKWAPGVNFYPELTNNVKSILYNVKILTFRSIVAIFY